MALIKCRECGKDVSTEAAACPSCGAPPSTTRAPTEEAASPPAEKKKAKKASLPVQIIGGLVVVGLVAMCSSNATKPGGKDAAQESAKPAECQKTDLKCRGEKVSIAASVYCIDPIENKAKHSVRWVDGTFELKFSRMRWTKTEGGPITVVGDKAEFQNGFGAWTRVIYECDIAEDDKTVVAVRVREGRLPK